jgi:hypothetical protein
MGFHHRVSEEIRRVMWMEHINHDHVREIHMPEDGDQCLWKWGCGQWSTLVFYSLRCRIHMPEDGDQCLWKWGCGQWSTLVFYSLRCRIRTEWYEFLIRFPHIIDTMDDTDM